ncbi:hypothetical protein ACVBEH_06390 [Roseateles sp. GG27B]
MNTLSELQALGLELPSPAYIFGALLFGLIGMLAFRHGRRSEHRVTLWLGVALMLYPYAVSSTWMLYGVGLALCAGIYLDRG